MQTSEMPARTLQPGDAVGRTILMVEDDATVMDVGAAILLDCGHAVVSVSTADEAMCRILGGQSFDLLFSDIVMPGAMNGVALAGEVRRLRPGVPILLTSGWADPAMDNQIGDQDYAFIGKPYRHADLARKIEGLFTGPETQS